MITSEFPRNWIVFAHQDNTGLAASCVIPAATGVVHVLSSIRARVTSPVATGLYHITVNGIVVGELYVNPSGADELDLDIQLSSGVGQVMTVAFDAAAAGGPNQTLMIQGYDI